MDLSTFIVSVFCLIDDLINKERRIRRCGPTPKLSDAEVLTIEVVGEFLGIGRRPSCGVAQKRYGSRGPEGVGMSFAR
jgi:hypothetical protein